MVTEIHGVIMKLSILTVLLFTMLFFPVYAANAGIATEATIDGGYLSNLFNDSNSIGDRYTAFGANMRYYPSSSVQISGAAQYSAFAAHSDLSNLAGETSIFYIPTSDSSAFMLALMGNLSIRKFGKIFELYNRVGNSLGADISYHLTHRVFLQTSLSYSNNNYINSEYGSNRSIDISAGLNTTILGSNAIALRLNYAHQSFDQSPLIQNGVGNGLLADRDKTESFDVSGLVVRFSRPLGMRTGINFSIGHRQLHVDNNFAVPGYTIDYLSPWSDLWEGTSLSSSVKHFFPNQLIAELSLAHYHKEYVGVMELSPDTGETYWQGNRSDQLTTFSINVSRPISLQRGKTITPSVFLGYWKNRSTAELFDYKDIRVSLALRISI
jgi:hypothetical protein